MSIYTQSALLAAIITLALSIGILIRGRRTPLHVYYAILNGVLSAWNLANFMGEITQSELWGRLGTFAVLFIPLSALKFFQTFLSQQGSLVERASRVIGVTTLIFMPVVISPLWHETWVHAILYAYIFGSLYLCVFLIWKRLKSTERRTESARLLYLAIGGFIAITFALVDALPLETLVPAAENTPALGNMMVAFYMYFLSQIIVQYRLLGLSELVGKIAVLAALVLLLTAIYGVLAFWLGDRPGLFAFYTLIVAFVLLILFEPMKVLIEERVNRLLFRERFEFERQLSLLRREMANVVDTGELAEILMQRLNDSRRITSASLYLLDNDGMSYHLAAKIEAAPEKLDSVVHRAFLEQLISERAVVREDLEDQLAERRREEAPEEEVAELVSLINTQEELGAGVSVPMLSQDRVIGILNLQDARLREAYTADEIRALVQIAAQAAISVENSRAVQALREKDRLAALGEMAAGLAHEIRNPLGAIKGAAQMLDLMMPEIPPVDEDDEEEEAPEEFLQIIIEEVNRLNSVVSQFLNYARPYHGEPTKQKVNHIIERAAPLWRTTAEQWDVSCRLELSESLPEVRIDAELMRQVLLNLAINAIQATGTPSPEAGLMSWEDEGKDGPRRGSGEREPELVVKTAAVRRLLSIGGRMTPRDMVEVSFVDNGKGIPAHEIDRLFIPFFTTKPGGTGLGLAICQRIIENSGGRLEVSSEEGKGSTFRVLLPLADHLTRSVG